MNVHMPDLCTVDLCPLGIDGSILDRIRGEFHEMPGMRISFAQATRLWAMDGAACQCALDHLVASGFLKRDDNGRYKRMHGGY